MQKTKNVASILSKNSWLLHKQLKWILIMPPTSFWINVYFEISDTSIPFDPTVFFNFQEKQNQKVIFKNTYCCRELFFLSKRNKVSCHCFFSNEYRNIQKSSIVDIKNTCTLRYIILICYYYIVRLKDKICIARNLVFMNNTTLKYTQVYIGFYYWKLSI